MTGDTTPEELRRRIRELTEENARLAEMVAARDGFLTIAAHELRNPMTPLVSRISMLRRAVAKGTIEPDKMEQSLEQLEGLSALFVKRATMLLDVSRITTGKLKLDRAEVDVCEVAQAVARNFEPLAEQAGSPIELDLPAAGLIVFGDRHSIEEILDNLVSNAIKYGAGSPVVVRIVADPASGTTHQRA